MQITRIAPQKKDKNRVNVYLDGKFAFGLPLALVIERGFKKGQEIDQEEIDTLRDKDEEERIYNRLVAFATLRPRSVKEIQDWFGRKKVVLGMQEAAIGRVSKIGLVDDYLFSKWWVEQRTAFRGFSRKLLALELRKKGIERSLIEKVLAEVEIPTEEELARRAYEKKKQTWGGLSGPAMKRKAYGFLGRRGFSFDVIRRIVDETG